MSVNLDVRNISSGDIGGINISATPNDKNIPLAQLAKEIFTAVKDVILSKNARILQERIFATETAMEIMEVLRRLNKEKRQTFVLVTHAAEVGDLTDRIIRMRDGVIEN